MEANYLKLGNQVFGITPIQAEGVDINEELKAFYDDKDKRMTEEFGAVLIAGATEEWNTQINHLQKFVAGRGEFKIPRELFEKPVMVYKGRLMECKFVVLAPTEVITSQNWLISAGCDISDLREGVEFPDSTSTMLVTIKPVFHLPLLLAYCKKTNTIYTPFTRTIHTMSGHNLCTGNYKASDFWALSDRNLTITMNRINTFSPAKRSVYYQDYECHIVEMVNKDTITAIVRRESVEWRT